MPVWCGPARGRSALRIVGALGWAAAAAMGLPGCGGPAPQATLALRQVHGAPLEAPPRLELIYEADTELPFVSQTCRGFNPLATGRRCSPTHEARALEATRAADGTWVFTFPEWVPGAVRHSVSRLDLALPGGTDVVQLREGDAGVSRAVIGERVAPVGPAALGAVPTSRLFAATLHSDRFELDAQALARFGLRFDQHTWSFEASTLWLDQAGRVMHSQEHTSGAALRWYEAGERPAGGPPPRLSRAVVPNPCAAAGRLTVWVDQGRLLWAEAFEPGAEVEYRRRYHFLDGVLLGYRALGSTPTGRPWPGATRSVEHAHFRDGTLIDWSLDDRVWRAAGVSGAMAVNAPPPDAAWQASIDRCVEAIQAAVPRARPLGEVP